MPTLRGLLALGAATVGAILPAAVQGQDDAPARERLGVVRFETSCPEAARAPFDRAVALLHHMTYDRARAEFAAIASEHPGCAMAHWGIAMTLFTPLWPTRPGEDDLRRGWQEVTTARKIGAGTRREQMF
ncbi:MAG TPA: hypothetical protein VE173_00115, partial [Longimicrobiales bacterium]|nr:hypothetical protein [Longimicrobiales bacterium]